MDKLMNTAKVAADKAGAYLRNRTDCHIAFEGGKDIKLDADRQSESIILECLKETGLPILSEEVGTLGQLSGKYWVVDPLDGSMNYLRGMEEMTCISIALLENDRPVMGVVYRWKQMELFWGAIGEGAFCNDKKIMPSDTSHVAKAILTTGFPVAMDYSEKSIHSFIRQVQAFKKIRMFGAAAIMGSFVAAGRVDAYMEEDIMLWDVAAAAALVEAAGGITNLVIGPDYRCQCRFFANRGLMEDYNAALL